MLTKKSYELNPTLQVKKGKFREIKCPETRTQMMASDSLSARLFLEQQYKPGWGVLQD